MSPARATLALLACLATLLAIGDGAAGAASLPSGFRDGVALDGMNAPTAFRIAPDGRVFVAEKNGRILVYDGVDDPTPAVFADLRAQVYDVADRGLLGLAVDPGFPQRPYVYALYTFDHVLGEDPAGEYPRWGQPPDYEGDPCPGLSEPGVDVDTCPVSGRLVRLTAAGDLAVDEDVLVEDWCQQFSSHSVGDLEFGPEGALYASGGDGASFTTSDYGQYGWPHANQCGDPPGGEALSPPSAEGGSLRALDMLTPADPANLDGTLIRIDPDSGEGWPGNPYAASADANARRIVAFGFRNPFRFALDPSGGAAYVGNVGADWFEELDRVPLAGPAYNSGWPCFEGPRRNPNFQGLGLGLCDQLYAQPSLAHQPFYFFPHYGPVTPDDPCPSENGSAITGSAFYEGDAFPEQYRGAFFFSDAVRGCIYVMLPDGDGEPDPSTTRTFLGEGGPYTGADIQVGPDGDLYYLSLYGDEALHRVSYLPGSPSAELGVDKEWGAKPLTVHYDAGGSSDPDGEELSYAWDLDGNGSFEDASGGATRTRVYNDEQNHTVGVQVEDPTGKTSSAEITVFPGDKPPRIEIEEPLEATSWAIGDELEFAGSARAKDGAGASIPATNLYWRTTILHCPGGGGGGCHAHPLSVFPGVDSGTLVAPDHDYPSRIRFSLTATDARGLSATKTVEVLPRTVSLSLVSDPPGIALTAGPQSAPAPFVLTAIEGADLGLAAPAQAQVGGVSYAFQGWSDGGARVHSVSASASTTYTATYSAPAGGDGDGDGAGDGGGNGGAGGGGGENGGGGTGDGAPPAPRLSGHPPAKTRARTARFAFGGGTGAKFVCRLDATAYAPCASPRSYRGLRPGRHVFRVAVAGPDGAAASDPVAFEWRVLAAGAARRGRR